MSLQCISEAAVSTDVNVNKTLEDTMSRLSLMIADRLVDSATINAFITVITATQ